MSYEDIRTKEEATAYIAAVMRSPVSLNSPNFKIAVEVSTRFEVGIQDILVFMRERARRA